MRKMKSTSRLLSSFLKACFCYPCLYSYHNDMYYIYTTTLHPPPLCACVSLHDFSLTWIVFGGWVVDRSFFLVVQGGGEEGVRLRRV